MSSETISAQGSTKPFPVSYLGAGSYAPGLLASLSNGAVLTYSIELTGDNLNAPGYNPATGNWVSPTDLTGLTASVSSVLLGLVTGVRATITSYTSGKLTFQVTQPPTTTGGS